MAAAEEIDARIDNQWVRPGIGHEAIDRHVARGRRSRHDADAFAVQPRIADGVDAVELAVRFEHERVGRAIVRVGDLDQIIALRDAHQNIASMRSERIAHETRRLRVPGIGQSFSKLRGEELRQLVLKPLPLLG